MPDFTLLAKASDLRARSEEVLARAKTFRNADARRKLRKIAEIYVELAERLERHAPNADERRHGLGAISIIRRQAREAPPSASEPDLAHQVLPPR